MQPQATKSPNVLLLTDDCKSPDCSTWTSEIETCVGSQLYTVYPLRVTAVTDVPWQESCKCLIVPTSITINKRCLNELLTFILNGGKCVSANGLLNRELLGTTLLPEGDDDSLGYEVRPLKSELESFFSYKVAASSLQGVSESGNGLQWNISTLAHLCLERPGPNSPVACVKLLEHENGLPSCVLSAVELLSPQQHTQLAGVEEIAKLRESLTARLLFLRWVFDKLGIKCAPAAATFTLSLAYMMFKSKEVC